MVHKKLWLACAGRCNFTGYTGFDFAPDAGAHGYRIGVHHTTGVTVYVSTTAPAMMNAMTLRHEEYKQKMMSAEAGPSLQGWKGFQFAHFVRPTDIFYPKLWSNASLALGGIWVPSYWVRSRFEPADPVAAAFKFGLSVPLACPSISHDCQA